MFLEDILLIVFRKKLYISFSVTCIWRFPCINFSFGFQVAFVVAVFFEFFNGNDFVVDFAFIVVVVVNFKCAAFVTLAAGIDVAAVYASFADFV